MLLISTTIYDLESNSLDNFEPSNVQLCRVVIVKSRKKLLKSISKALVSVELQTVVEMNFFKGNTISCQVVTRNGGL